MMHEGWSSYAKRYVCGAVAIAGLLAPAHGVAESPSAILWFGDSAPAVDQGAYAAGTKAMNEKRWLDAVHSFDRVIAARSDRADAAMYWKAYALRKLGNAPSVMATCVQLQAQYQASSWNQDCSALSLQAKADLRRTAGQQAGMPIVAPVVIPPIPPMPPMPSLHLNSPGGGDPDAELKILALNSLLNQDPARAVPVLRGLLTGNQPESVKKHAIFVLAQSKSPEAQATLSDAVRGKMSPDLQRQAIEMMAIFEGKRANDTLAEVYRSTGDAQVKRSVIQAFFLTQDAPRMVDLARNEKDLELKRQLVSQLALMHDKAAQDYMMELLK